MDFIVGLPRTQARYDSIWVILDCLTKVAHFIPVKTTYSGAKLAELYMSRIVCLHGVLGGNLSCCRPVTDPPPAPPWPRVRLATALPTHWEPRRSRNQAELCARVQEPNLKPYQ
jgi:hypothetical protein